MQRGDFAAAEAELRAVIDIDVTLAGADNWRTARAESILGWILILRDHRAEGESLLASARTKLVATVGPAHAATIWASARLEDARALNAGPRGPGLSLRN